MVVFVVHLSHDLGWRPLAIVFEVVLLGRDRRHHIVSGLHRTLIESSQVALGLHLMYVGRYLAERFGVEKHAVSLGHEVPFVKSLSVFGGPSAGFEHHHGTVFTDRKRGLLISVDCAQGVFATDCVLQVMSTHGLLSLLLIALFRMVLLFLCLLLLLIGLGILALLRTHLRLGNQLMVVVISKLANIRRLYHIIDDAANTVSCFTYSVMNQAR